MEGFDSMTMQHPFLAGPVAPVGDLVAMPTTMQSGLSLEAMDHHSNYDADTWAGSEDASQYGTQFQPPLPTAQSYDGRFSATFDDTAYSEVPSNFDPNMANEGNVMDGGSSIEGNHKRLLFSAPVVSQPILDYNFRRTAIQMTAQLHGMFFLAESSLPVPGDNNAPQTELTCYRRNLFQVTGNLTMPRGLRYFISETGEQIPVIAQELAISATETVEKHAVKIICVPWKTPITSAPATEDKSEKEPMSIPIDLAGSGQDLDPDFVTIPIAWKRLQFRIATANNGRRKELQQHFLVHLRVVATLANGVKVNLHEIVSDSIVVRGRSPRNFQSKKDMPISGSGSFSRRREPALTRTSTGESAQMPALIDRGTSNNLEVPQIPFSFDSKDLAMSPGLFDWNVTGGPPAAMTALPSDFVFNHSGPVNAYAQSTPDLTRPMHTSRTPAQEPINLSLVEEDSNRRGTSSLAPTSAARRTRKTSSSSPIATPLKKARIHKSHTRPPSFSLGPINTTDESADMLYEYFPLGLDDWMPPVDAVYRPHVVHHTNLPADPKAIKNRSKRYFSEDQAV